MPAMRVSDEVAIRQLTTMDPWQRFVDIACLHAGEIHHGMLPRLGIAFMARLYFELARAPRTTIWIAWHGEQLAGFLAGCADMRHTYRWVLVRPRLLLRFMLSVHRALWLGAARLLSPFTYLVSTDAKSAQREGKDV